MDLKIELRKLYALHEATIRFDHAIRESGSEEWRVFAPSRFVYAFFTFNSIYSFDWSSSFETKKAIRWAPDASGRIPKEEEQFKAYIRYVDSVLTPRTSEIVSEKMRSCLTAYAISDPAEELKAVDMENADKKLRELSQQLPGEFRRLWQGKAVGNQFFSSACVVFRFIYAVRCNLFHGAKTRVHLLDPAQQRRLLVYATALITVNSLLFRIAENAGIGWRQIAVDFASQ